MANVWDEVPMNDKNWSKARTAIATTVGPDGYADVINVAIAFGGAGANFDRGAARHLLERFNDEYPSETSSFEQHPADANRWKNA